MIEFTKVIPDEIENAGVALLGSREAVLAELDAGIDKMTTPWVAKSSADMAKATLAEAAALKEKYDRVKAADPREAEKIDAILATAAVSADPNAEPLEP